MAGPSVSRHTERRKARINELAEELSIGAAMRLRCDSDDIRQVVDAVVAYLVEEYPSQDLYIPASLAPPVYPVAAIRSDIKAGKSLKEVCQKYRVSRRTVYALLESKTVKAA